MLNKFVLSLVILVSIESLANDVVFPLCTVSNKSSKIVLPPGIRELRFLTVDGNFFLQENIDGTIDLIAINDSKSAQEFMSSVYERVAERVRFAKKYGHYIPDAVEKKYYDYMLKVEGRNFLKGLITVSVMELQRDKSLKISVIDGDKNDGISKPKLYEEIKRSGDKSVSQVEVPYRTNEGKWDRTHIQIQCR